MAILLYICFTLLYISSDGTWKNPLSIPLLVSVTSPSLALVTQGLGETGSAVGKGIGSGYRVSHPAFATYCLCDLGQVSELLCASSSRKGNN